MNSTLLSSFLTFVSIFTGRLITGGRDGRLRIWNYNNGHCLRTLEKSKISTDSRTERECLREKYCIVCFKIMRFSYCCEIGQVWFDDNPFELLKIDSLFGKLNASSCVSKFSLR